MLYFRMVVLIFYFLFTSCGDSPSNNVTIESTVTDLAKIVNVKCIGRPNNYTFDVTIESDETGCDQYADWWEVITSEGELIYRRVLSHSHVTEQPFTRSGGVIDVGADEFVYVRAHMNVAGYGSVVFSGTPRQELTADTLSASFALELAEQAPLPDGCDF